MNDDVKVSYFTTGNRNKKLNPDDFAVGFNVIDKRGIPFTFGLSPLEAGEFTEDDLKRGSRYISKYYDEIFGPDTMSREDREKDLAALETNDPVLYKLLKNTVGRHAWRKDDDGTVTVDLNSGFQGNFDLKNRKDTFSDKSKDARTYINYKPETLEKRALDKQHTIQNAIDKQRADYAEDVDVDRAKESLDNAKARGDLANVGYKSEKQGGGLSGRSQGQLNQLRKTFVKNLLNTEKYPENASVLKEYGITDNDKDALLTFLKGAKGDSSVYGNYMDKFLDPVERTRAIFEDYKKQGKTDDAQSAILAGLRRM